MTDWSAWDVCHWCPLTGALPDLSGIDDRSRIVAMIDQLREDFFAVRGGVVCDTPEDANELDAPSGLGPEARKIWAFSDQIERAALGGAGAYPGIADAWRELPAGDILDNICGETAARLSGWGEAKERAAAAERWPAHRILAVLAIGQLATVLRNMLAGIPLGIELGAGGRRSGVELLQAVGVMQIAYSLRASADQRAGEALRAHALRISARRADRNADTHAEWIRVARRLIEDRSFSSLSACAAAVLESIGQVKADKTLSKVAKVLSTDTAVSARCKSVRGRPPSR